MTPDEMIDKMVEDMESWDLEEIIGWAQQVRRDMLGNLDEASIREEYEFLFPTYSEE